MEHAVIVLLSWVSVSPPAESPHLPYAMRCVNVLDCVMFHVLRLSFEMLGVRIAQFGAAANRVRSTLHMQLVALMLCYSTHSI